MNKIEINQFEFQGASKKNRIKSSIESLLFVSGEPLNLKTLSSNVEVAPKVLEKILDEMMDEYEEESRGIKLISINGEYQLVTKAQNSEFVQRLLKKNKRQSLSQASLESLAIIAYKQPITRVDIDEIRGVKSESAIQRLIEKELIKEVGRLEVPGRPILFGTTEEFLRQFGLKALNDLPSLDLYSEKEQDESLEILNNEMKEL
ncbi:segregation/condensation protein B [Clostridium chauvoei]|uniref:SMC-Scp complex subunit ScpB n=1 Tax=Clostridium chauvoei TaxID=46867 RepID=UPI001C8496FD|nr:SMC-Scp complex subunit ScpB [Clostridium chauvoei]MBX7309602.1 segregation/condensation protein B [Clostridium chauvoei]MBX7314758.1 segregation/condensation protein B [Clostridium chauvoei]MBX7342496.1 segregation/condensation protein B [Clostridium chauvoei]